MKTVSNEQILDEFIGKRGTTEREAFENELKADVSAYKFKELKQKKQCNNRVVDLKEKL